MVKSMLLVPRLLLDVVKLLSSFIICNCLLIRNSPSILPVQLVSKSCHEVDLELLAITLRMPAFLLYYCFYFQQINVYLPVDVKIHAGYNNVLLPVITYKATASSSDSCFISVVSTLLLFTIFADRCYPSPIVKIFKFFDKPTILLRIVYGS